MNAKYFLIINRVNKVKFLETVYRSEGNLSLKNINKAKLDFHRVFFGWYNGLKKNNYNVKFVDTISYVIPPIIAKLFPRTYLLFLKILNTNKIKYNVLKMLDEIMYTIHILIIILMNKPDYILFPYDSLNGLQRILANFVKSKTISYFGVIPSLRSNKVKKTVLKYDHIISGYNLPSLWPEVKDKFQRIYIGPSSESNYTNYISDQKDIDVCIVGGFGGEVFNIRAEIIENILPELIKRNVLFKIFGYGKGVKFPSQFPILNRNIKNPIYSDKFYSVIKSTKIWINIPSNQHIMINSTRPQGILEISASNTFQLVLETKEASNIFEPEKEIVLFKNSEELLKKILYYLNNYNEALEIAKNSYDKFISSYTGEIQIIKLIERINGK